MTRFQKGYTIIEVMIALTLSLILAAGLTQIFIANSRTFDVSEASSRTQETGRLALSILSREIRNADYWGCQGSEGSLMGNIVNMLNTGSGVDLLLQGIGGENDTGPGGSDILSLGGVDANSAIKVSSQPSPNAASIKLTDTTEINDFDILLVTNCQRGHMFQVTNANDNGNVVHNTGNVQIGPGNAFKEINPSYNDDPNGASVFRPKQQRFYLRDNTTTGRREFVVDGISVLGSSGAIGTLTTPIALFEDVQNFQFQYGRDTNNDGRVDAWADPSTPARPADPSNPSDTGDPATPDYADEAIAIRMSILVRSPDDGVTDGGQSYCYPGWLDCASDSNRLTISGTNDTFLYRVYTTTSTLRNRI